MYRDAMLNTCPVRIIHSYKTYTGWDSKCWNLLFCFPVGLVNFIYNTHSLSRYVFLISYIVLMKILNKAQCILYCNTWDVSSPVMQL